MHVYFALFKPPCPHLKPNSTASSGQVNCACALEMPSLDKHVYLWIAMQSYCTEVNKLTTLSLLQRQLKT